MRHTTPALGVLLTMAALLPVAAAADPLTLSAAAVARDVYVSPAGSDGSGDGTQAKPFATLPRAQSAARKALVLAEAEGTAGGVTVHLGAGKYYQSAPLVLTEADSGRNGGRMRWTGPGPAAGIDPAAAAVVHGGVAVPAAGWQRSAPGSPIWRVNVSALAPPTRPAPPPPPPPPPPPGPPLVPNATLPHCGTAEIGVSYDHADIPNGEVWTGGIDQCCLACAAHPGCKAWSYCLLPPNTTCGSVAKPVDCYMKSSATGPHSKMAQRVSGTPGSGCYPSFGPAPPPPPPIL